MKKQAGADELAEALRHLSAGEADFADELESSIRQVVDHARDKVQAHVVSAIGLSAEQKNKLAQILEKLLRRKVRATYEIKPQILGGFRVQMGDWKLDATLATQIDRLTRALSGDTHG